MLDEAGGKAEPGAPVLFETSHPAAIDFVVVAHQVKNTVEHQDLDLLLDGVPEFTGLCAGAGE